MPDEPIGPGKESTLDQLKRLLYSPKVRFTPSTERTALKNPENSVPGDWPTEEFERSVEESKRYDFTPPSTMSKKILIGAIVFFVLAIIVAAGVIFFGGNIVSGNKISVAITGPISIEAGSPLSYRVSIENDNASALQGVDLSVAYPAGASSASGSTREDDQLADIPAHGLSEQDFSAILYGAENSVATITVQLSYTVTGSSAVFTKEKDYPVTISSAPLTLSVTGPTSATAGEPFSFNVAVGSNATTPLQNTLVQVDYPFGFTPQSATPAASFGNNVWNLGTLAPGQQSNIVVTGLLSGAQGDNDTFRFSAGPGASASSQTINPIFVSSVSTVALEAPFIGLTMSLNGNTTGQYAAPSGQPVQVDVHYVNNLSTAVENAQLSVALAGTFDPSSVQPSNGGFYQSADNTITWDSTDDPDLATLAPGASGDVMFSITPQIAVGATNPNITLSGSVSGDRPGETGVPESVTAEISSNILVASDLTGTAIATYATGPFLNTGPLPPKANTPTSYTITLTAQNSVNAISHATLTATLPSYVTWLSQISPASAPLSISGNTITWNIGNIAASSGAPSTSSVSFQVSLTPSVSQEASAPTLLSNIVLMGADQYASANLRIPIPDITTTLSTDPSFKPGDDQVTQ